MAGFSCLPQEGPSLFGERYIEARYEDLLSDPVAGSQRLFDRLGLDAPGELLDRVAAEARAEFNVDPGSPGVRADKWRDELSSADLSEIERVAGADLRELGYSDEGDGAPARQAAPPRGGLITALKQVRNPMRTLESRIERQISRSERRQLVSNLEVAERFADLVARGEGDAAAALCAPNGVYRIADDGDSGGGRGPDHLTFVLGALSAHHRAGLTPVTSAHSHSTRSFTTVLTYRLADGHEWTQTSVVEVTRGLITSVAVHRFERVRGEDV